MLAETKHRKSQWIAFDLGITGDHESLYTWLDDHNAKECGNNLAVLSYRFQGDLLTTLKQGLSAAVTIGKRDRIYVIWREDDTRKVKGHFLFGKRKAAPWVGFGTQEPQLDEEA